MACRRRAGQPARLAGTRGVTPHGGPLPQRRGAPATGGPGCVVVTGAARPRIGTGRHPGPLLHVLPPRLGAGVGRRPHAAGRGRAHDEGDRGRLPRPRGDDGPAGQPGQAHHGRLRRAVRTPRRGRQGRAPRPRAPRHLPRLQRGLCVEQRSRSGPDGPRLGGDPSRPSAARVAARRSRADRPPGPHVADRGAPAGPHGGRRRTRPPGRPGPLPLGPRPDRGGHRAGRLRAGSGADGRIRGPGRHRRAARCGAPPRGHRLGADPGAVLTPRADERQPRGAAEPGGRRGDGRGS